MTTRKASSALEMPYLEAIQSIPGDTASEKLSWIGKLARCEDEVIGELDKLPPKLQPLLEVETAIRYQRYEDIASALKSDDWTIVNRALKAGWFFDGDHMIVDVGYFSQYIFPYISLRTRIRLVKTFVRRIKSSAFAQQIFVALEYVYNYQTALPLLVCCDEDFAYNTVVERKLMLPLGVFKKIFRRNIDLAVRFLKSFIFDCNEYAPINEEIAVNDQYDVIERYKPFLSLLPKSRPMDFVDIAETIAICPNITIMSNKCAKKFLSEAEEHVVKYPHLYMPVLPTKAINSRQMEMMFPALMKYYCDCCDFDTNFMLNYLKDYPKNGRFALLCKTFKDVYHDEFFNNLERVTPELLKLLPLSDRTKLAKIKLDLYSPIGTNTCSPNFLQNKTVCSHNALMYELNWVCYLPVETAVPTIKYVSDQTKCEDEKVSYFIQMMYACLVNEDDAELFQTLTYIADSPIMLNPLLSKLIIDHFLLIFDMRTVYLSKENVSLMLEIVESVYGKHKYINELVFEKMIHLSIIHKIPIKILIYILTNSYQVTNIKFNILKDYPPYERYCLVTFIDVYQILYSDIVDYEEENEVKGEEDPRFRRRKMKKKKSKQEQVEKNAIVCRLIVAMYDFNCRSKKSHIRVKRMTIKDYPWLINVIHVIMRSEQICLLWKEARDALRKQEREFYYNSIFPHTLTEIADVKSGAALRMLKRNLQSIQDNWEEYFTYCKRNHTNKQVQSFVRAIRWYKDVPVKFAKKCIDHHLHREFADEKSLLVLLSILLHSDTIKKLITLRTVTRMNVSNYRSIDCNRFTSHLNICTKFFNPPLPLKLFIENDGTFDKSYVSTMLMALRSVSRRSSLSEVMLFSNNFQNVDVNVRKQWIELMYVTVPTNYFITFLETMWSVERHRSIRRLLLNTAQRLLCERPRRETWALCCKIFLGLSVEEEQLFWEMKYRKNIPDVYSEVYFNLWFDTINALSMAGLSIGRTKQHTEKCLKHLRWYIYVSLSEQYVENVFWRFLFHGNTGISDATRNFAITYLLQLSNDELTSYSKIIFHIIYTTIAISWDVSLPANSLFYPIRRTVNLYFEQFITAYMKKRKNQYFDGEVLENILLIFSTALSPKENIRSYLLLMYAKKLHAFSYVAPIVDSNFGLQLGQIIPHLINKLSHYMIDFMAVLLDHFLKNIYSPNRHCDVMFNTINGLIDAKNTYSSFMAMTLLSLQERCWQFRRIIDKALDTFTHHSSYAIILYHYLNETNFDDVPSDDELNNTIEDIN